MISIKNLSPADLKSIIDFINNSVYISSLPLEEQKSFWAVSKKAHDELIKTIKMIK